MAQAILKSLPISAVNLIGSEDWKGGHLLILKSDVHRPTADECAVNAPWMEPLVQRYPDRVAFKHVGRLFLVYCSFTCLGKLWTEDAQVPSGFFLTDVMLALNVLFDCKMLKPREPHDTVQSVAAREATRLKHLLSSLRYLWRSSVSDDTICLLFVARPAALTPSLLLRSFLKCSLIGHFQ